MYKFEQANEIKLYNEKIKPLLSQIKNGKYKMLENCITEDSVDYIQFMSLIKLLEDDSKESLQLLNEYAEQLQRYSSKAQELTKNKSYTDIKTSRGQLSEEIQMKLPTTHKSELANIFHDFIHYNASEQTARGSELRAAVQEHILPMILSGQSQMELSAEAETGFYTMLINRIEQYIKLNNETQEQTAHSLYEQILHAIQSFSPDDPHFEQLQQLYNSLLQHVDILESMGKQLERKISLTGNKIKINSQKNISGLKKNIRSALEQQLKSQNEPFTIEIRDGQGNIVEYNPYKESHKEQYITQIVKKMFPNETNLSLEEMIALLNKVVRAQKSRKEIITLVTEHKSALTIDSIRDTVITIVDGYLNNKNDVTSFIMGKALVKTKNDVVLDSANSQAKNIMRTAIQNSEKTFNQSLSLRTRQQKEKIKHGGFDIEAQTQAQTEAEYQMIEELRDELATIDLQINDIKNLFQLDDSAKFAETFMVSEGGFAGGSIGGDIDKQIFNINKMLEWGGITPLDAERLVAMVLNSGDALIGSKNRSALENYFSTVGSMLMFRTGGNALQQWYAQATNAYTNTTTKIHLYTLGTLYVPESYVLLKTYEALNQCASLLNTEAKSTGSRAKIYNPVTEANIINEGTLQQRFEKTAAANYSAVSIDMVIMGGFLDLIDNMLTIMNSIA